MSCCGTFRLSDEPSCCGSFRPTSVEPPPEPVAVIDATHSDPGIDTVDKPAGVVDGTWLVAAVGSDVDVLTPPAGFVQVGNTAYFDNIFAGFSWSQKIYAKEVTSAGTEPATYTFSGASYTDIWLVALANASGVGDITERPVGIGGTTGTTSNGASVTALADGAMLLRFESANQFNRDTEPPGMTPLAGSPFDTSFNADSESLSAGASGDRDATYAVTQTWVVHMVAVEPLP
jgi:hypothetical protein